MLKNNIDVNIAANVLPADSQNQYNLYVGLDDNLYGKDYLGVVHLIGGVGPTAAQIKWTPIGPLAGPWSDGQIDTLAFPVPVNACPLGILITVTTDLVFSTPDKVFITMPYRSDPAGSYGLAATPAGYNISLAGTDVVAGTSWWFANGAMTSPTDIAPNMALDVTWSNPAANTVQGDLYFSLIYIDLTYIP